VIAGIVAVLAHSRLADLLVGNAGQGVEGAKPVDGDWPMLRRMAGFGRRRQLLIDRLGGNLDPLVQMLFQDPGAGVLVVDREGAIVRANETLRRMLARRVDLSPGAPAGAMFREVDRAALRQALAGVSAEGGAAAGNLLARLETAETDPDHMVDVAVTVLREEDGSVSGAMLRLTDITAQKRLEAQLAHSQKLQAVGQLAGGIAHDFNNLLTAISGAAEAILERDEPAGDPQSVRPDAQQILESAERGAGLVRQLLAFGRQQTLQPRALAVNEAITALASLLDRLLGGQIRLVLDLEAPGRMVRADPTQLDQVLVNLAVNARDAMPDGGTLTLRSGHINLYRPLTLGEETIPPGRYVMIEVQDTGIGIAADVLPRIFDPFFTTRRERGGNGLGLSTVHGIVRQSDGFLAVESSPGQGSRFRIYLPRVDAEPQPSGLSPAGLSKPAVAPVAARRVVLLVDDEDAVRRLAERALTRRGWTVLAADQADAALALVSAQKGKIDAVISDVVMPGMDGPALVRALRETRPMLPAILVSGYAEESLRRELAGSHGAFLAKPYALRELADLLDQVVQD
jgi:two-component system cell cycle sensor histidine kinase/response regulator CckA